MSRMKTFGKYLILFVAFYIFVNFMSYELVKSSYANIKCAIETNNLEISISEAKAARESGIIRGKVKNTYSEDLKSKYIKLDFISDQGTKITTKYIDISNLKVNEEKEFNVRFKAENIKKIIINEVENVEEGSGEIVSQEMVNTAIWGFLIWLIVWPF